MGDSAVKVAVRVRPFNSREQAEGAELCVEMDGNMTRLYKAGEQERKYFFDYSYWSHDEFDEKEDGMMVPSGSKYADQNKVFNDIGVDVLNNAWEGYHTCLFAYGQTGSGKSYSMVGYGVNKGIIPITCEEIFTRISANTDENRQFDVKVAMLEIYNEQIQDLLVPPAKRVQGGLKIREDPKTGVFIQGLSKQDVASYAQISKVLDDGNKHRTVAATQMNATSSRAHTVLTISFTQIFYDPNTGQPLNRKQSDINLVDLAGSERAQKTGATGDRLREGSNINKSLSTLGKVITALAKRSSGELKKGEVIPYRESALTRILSVALGGNSKTTMIAAISPATFNYDETLSTLRYADQVKAIKNKAVVNETAQEKLIRELREENERLKSMMGGAGATGAPGAAIDEDAKAQYEAEIEELRRKMEESEQSKAQQAQTTAEHRIYVPVAENVTTPHLMNLNEDPLLSGYIKHTFQPGENKLGRNANIKLNGLGIADEHASIAESGGSTTITPIGQGKTMVNGEAITGPVTLKHGDRVRFGQSVYFTYIDPNGNPAEIPNYETAAEEANEAERKSLLGAKDEEFRQKEEAMKSQIMAEFEESRRRMDAEKDELAKIIAAQQKDQSNKNSELERQREEQEKKAKMLEDELRRKEFEIKKLERNKQARQRLDGVLMKSLNAANEANQRARYLSRNVNFSTELYQDPTKGMGIEATNVRTKVKYPQVEMDLYMSPDDLVERIPDMADLCQQYENGTDLDKLEMNYDPFVIDIADLQNQPDIIGRTFVELKTMFYLLDIPEEFHPIYDPKGQGVGQLKLGLDPQVESEKEDLEEMTEAIGAPCNLIVKIPEAIDLIGQHENVYLTYNLSFVGGETIKVETLGATNRPQFNHDATHTFHITNQIARHFENEQFIVNLFGQMPEAEWKRKYDQAVKALNQASVNSNIEESKNASDSTPVPAVSQPNPPPPASTKQPEPSKPTPTQPAPQATPVAPPAAPPVAQATPPAAPAAPNAAPVQRAANEETKQAINVPEIIASKPSEHSISGTYPEANANKGELSTPAPPKQEKVQQAKSGCCLLQ